MKGETHEGADVERALVHEPEVALELAVVGGEEGVGVVEPAPLGDGVDDPPAGLVDDELVEQARGQDVRNPTIVDRIAVVLQEHRFWLLRCLPAHPLRR